MLINQQLSEGHGKILAGLAPLEQMQLADRCVQKGWNVRQIELEAKRLQLKANALEESYSDVNIKN